MCKCINSKTQKKYAMYYKLCYYSIYRARLPYNRLLSPLILQSEQLNINHTHARCLNPPMKALLSPHL